MIILSKRYIFLWTDLEPPKIVPCPGDIKIISTARWHKLALPSVNVTDNVGVELFSTNIQNGSEMTWGEHNVTYKALDRAGNAAYCRFLYTIAGRLCFFHFFFFRWIVLKAKAQVGWGGG